MAAPKENLMSVGHLSGNERITFTKQRGHGLNKSVYRPDFSTPQSHQNVKVMHLQQRWQELKEREHIAQQHNWQLLQQFEEAQDTLREMLARNAAMKTIRIEYERYLEESAPRWEQQLKEKTQAAQRKRTEEYLRSCQKNTEEQQMKKSPADRRLLSQGLTKKPQTVSAPQENNNQNINSDYDQDVFSHLPYVQSSWLTHTQSQTARFPNRVPGQPRGSSYVPPSYLPSPSILPHPHQFQLHHPGHHHFWPRQDPPDWASPQSNYPSSWITGAAGILSGSEALWGQLYTEEPPHEREAEAETSRAPSSKRERSGGSRSSHLSQELDIKPVRLSSDHAESSEGGRDSSQASREKKRRRRGKTQQSSSDRERCSSQKSSTASSAIIAGAAMVQSSESEASSEKGSAKCSRSTRRRSMGLSVGSLRTEMTVKGRSNDDNSTSHKDECRSTAEESGSPDQSKSENVENQSPVDKSDSHREEESESVSLKMEKQESSSSEESGAEEKDEEYQKDLGKEDDDDDDGEEKEKSWRDEEQDKRNVCASDDKVSARKNRMEEEDDTREEDESEEEGDDEDDDKLKSEEGENRKPASVSSQDEEEDEDERDVNKMGEDESDEEEEEEEEEEEQKSDEAGKPEETRDSDDSIISPQDNRLKKIHIIPEEAAEDDNNDDDKSGSKSGSSDEDSNELSEEEEEEEEEEEDNHIEDLLAPQEQTNKKEKDLKVDDKPKVTCDAVEVFQAELTDHQSDSDEFDHFYD